MTTMMKGRARRRRMLAGALLAGLGTCGTAWATPRAAGADPAQAEALVKEPAPGAARGVPGLPGLLGLLGLLMTLGTPLAAVTMCLGIGSFEDADAIRDEEEGKV